MIAYPFETPPDTGQAVEVAEGVLWLRLPLPMKLDHVNIYALDDGDGWTLIDTGMKWGKVDQIWDQLLTGPLAGKPVHRVVMTHHHPDHVGFNGWFVGQGAEHVASRTAWLMARMLTLDVQDHYTDGQIEFYTRAGMRPDLLEKRRHDRPFNFADIAAPIPLGYTRIKEGDQITMGGRVWDIHMGHGHAPEHATFWSRDDHLVIGGDQLLPSISPNIGVYPTEPEGDPLAEWLESCTRLSQFARPDQVVLCGHKRPFTGLPKRLEQLIENHHNALARLRKTLHSPHSAGDVFHTLFKRDIGDGEYGLALVESLAHCLHLWHLGEVTREIGAKGAYLFQMYLFQNR